MSRVKVTIIRKEVAEFDIGDLLPTLIQTTLEENDGHFNSDWTLGDVCGNITYTVESIAVEEVGKNGK